MAWAKAGTTTLGSAGDDLDITSMTANKFNVYLSHTIASGDIGVQLTFNNVGGTSYADRNSVDGGSDSTNNSGSNIGASGGGATGDGFSVIYVADISGEEKLLIGNNIQRNTAGAGTSPRRKEFVGKTSATTAITRIDEFNGETGSYDTNSNISVLGSDGTAPALNVQDGAIYYDTDLNKEYVLYNNTWTEI